jgi:hypothetical protein
VPFGAAGVAFGQVTPSGEPVPSCRARNVKGAAQRRTLPVTLLGKMEEGLILAVVDVWNHHGSAYRSGIRVIRGRVGCAGSVGVRMRGPVGLARLAVKRAMQGVRSTLQYGVEDASARTRDLCVVGVGLQLYLLRSFEGRDDDGAVVRVRNRHAIDEVIVRSDGAAGDRNLARSTLVLEAVEARIADCGHVCAQLGEKKRVTAQIRKIFKLLRVDVLAV